MRPVRRDIRAHLDDFVDEDQDALVFTGAKGATLRRSNFQSACKWRDAVAAAGLPGLSASSGSNDQGPSQETCPELGPRLERVTGIEPALSAWELPMPACLTG
ncbi:hypothetical protein [Micromonospora sp. URMC 103]|uniref:hypothetical protein n=1 Tax=Micromonospora sp. URMC 103 TaxID=3423406 RepID=UPI003F1D2EAC